MVKVIVYFSFPLPPRLISPSRLHRIHSKSPNNNQSNPSVVLSQLHPWILDDQGPSPDVQIALPDPLHATPETCLHIDCRRSQAGTLPRQRFLNGNIVGVEWHKPVRRDTDSNFKVNFSLNFRCESLSLVWCTRRTQVLGFT